MYTYDFSKKEEQLKEYKIQILFSFFAILALLISASVVKDLYFQAKDGINRQKTITKKSKLSSIIVLITAVYFVYISFKTYQENKTKANMLFLIASELALVAAFIRYITINNDDVTNIADTF